MPNKPSTIIIGLGNPGPDYANTPHNVGFVVIDKLARIWNLESGIWKKEKNAELARFIQGDQTVVLAKPTTFMNNSGTAVKSLISKFQIPNSNVWLVHDDIDLPLGTVRVQYNRGSAGHRGVQDVIDKLGTQKFYRFRIGVRPSRVPRVRSREWMNTFVTQRATGERKKKLDAVAQNCVQLIEEALGRGIEKIAGDHLVK